MAELRDFQYEFDLHGLIRKHDPAIVDAIEDAGVE